MTKTTVVNPELTIVSGTLQRAIVRRDGDVWVVQVPGSNQYQVLRDYDRAVGVAVRRVAK